MPLQAARTRVEIARTVSATEPALAVEEARMALSTFDEVGAVRDADLAASLLRDLGATGRAGPKGLERLTKREREILALLGQGLTNAEIAARLSISTKTAAHHVSNILAKLGVRNRSEAAAYAHRYLSGVEIGNPSDPSRGWLRHRGQQRDPRGGGPMGTKQQLEAGRIDMPDLVVSRNASVPPARIYATLHGLVDPHDLGWQHARQEELRAPHTGGRS